MVSIDSILYKINLLIKKEQFSEAILVLDNAIQDDLVTPDEEKQLSIKYLQLLLLRKTPEDIQKFKEWCMSLKKNEFDPEMTEYVYNFVAYLLTYDTLTYKDDEYKLYKDIMSWNKKHFLYISLLLNEYSFTFENPELRFDKQVEAMNEYMDGLDEENTESAKEYFKTIKSAILSKKELNSDDKRMIDLFYILDI